MPTISDERKETLSGSNFELIVHPTEIVLSRNPETGSASITWKWKQHLAIDGNVRLRESVGTGTNFRTIAQIGSLSPAYPGAVDPNTGTDLTTISVDGAVAVLLDAFDRAYVQDSGV